MFSPLYSNLPAFKLADGLLGPIARFKAAIDLSGLNQGSVILPKADRQTSRKSGSLSSCIQNGGTLNRNAQHISLKLHQKVILTGSPIDFQNRNRGTHIVLDCLHHFFHLIGDRL